MNKKLNTLLFILGATLFNVFVAIVSFIILLFLYTRFLMPLFAEETLSWAFFALFVGAIAISFVVYRVVLKFLLKKYQIEKYLDPIFGRKYQKKVNDNR